MLQPTRTMHDSDLTPKFDTSEQKHHIDHISHSEEFMLGSCTAHLESGSSDPVDMMSAGLKSSDPPCYEKTIQSSISIEE